MVVEGDRLGGRRPEAGGPMGRPVPERRPDPVLRLGALGPVEHGVVVVDPHGATERGEDPGRIGEESVRIDDDRRAAGRELVFQDGHLLGETGDRGRELGVERGVEGGDDPGRIADQERVGELVEDRCREGVEVVADVLHEADGLVGGGPDRCEGSGGIAGHGGDDLGPSRVARVGMAEIDAVEGLVEHERVGSLAPAVHERRGDRAGAAPHADHGRCGHGRAARSIASR